MKLTAAAVVLVIMSLLAAVDAESDVLQRLRAAEIHASVPPELFERLGWELPDAGRRVREIADAAPGGAFDPRSLSRLNAADIGYAASWHVVRYRYYGIDWDITALRLTPRNAEPGLPTVVFINGGSANWYEFFVDPLNGPAVGQYLAQRVPVLLVTIPGNYRDGGWEAPIAQRKPAYLLDRELDDREVKARNVIMTFAVVAEGVRRIVEEATQGPLLIAGHSTGGEIQFLLRDALRSRLNGRSLGWGTGGPAALRRTWQEGTAATRNRGRFEVASLRLAEVRVRTPQEYARSYIGPLNPLGPGPAIEVAGRWFERENRRRPQFKQPLQDIEHRGEHQYLEALQQEIPRAIRGAGLPSDAAAVASDLFSTLRTPLGGYERMVWTTAAGDDGHWDADPKKARELFVAQAFKQANPRADVRVLVFDVPMSHYGHIEKPRQLAGGLLAAVKWLYRR